MRKLAIELVALLANVALVVGPLTAAYLILARWTNATDRRIADMRRAYELNRDRMASDQVALYHRTLENLETTRRREERLGCVFGLLTLALCGLVAAFLFANAHAIVRAMHRAW